MPDDTRGRLIEMAQGVLIEEDVLGIVQRIQEYDPNIRVQFLDPNSEAGMGDPPYRIMEICPDGIMRLVFSVWELDERVMMRLFNADNRKQDILKNLDTVNANVREGMKRRFREEALAEAHEMTVALVKTNKTEYTLPGKEEGENIVIHSHQPSKTVTKTGLVKADNES